MLGFRAYISANYNGRPRLALRGVIFIEAAVPGCTLNYQEADEAEGYSIGVIKLIAKKVGLNVEIVQAPSWQDLLQRFQAGDIDVIPAIYSSRERRSYADFTKGYRAIHMGIVAQAGRSDITGIASLADERVAGIPDYVTTRTLALAFPELEFVEVQTNLQGIHAVARGEADAYVSSITVAQYLINASPLFRMPSCTPFPFATAMRKSWVERKSSPSVLKISSPLMTISFRPRANGGLVRI